MNRIANKLIKVLSLAAGLSVGMVLIAKICYELSFDRVYEDSDRIYTVYTEGGRSGEELSYPQTSGAIAPGFMTEIPEVEEATRYTGVFDSDSFYEEDGDSAISGHLVSADTCFFKVFPREILTGDPQSALSSWNNTVAVSRSFSEKLGGPAQAIGKVIYNESLPSLKFTISGVFEDFPHNSTVSADLVVSIEAMSKSSTENWVGNDRYHSFVKLLHSVDPSSLAPAISEMLARHVDVQALSESGISFTYTLKPYSREHISLPSVRSLIFILGLVSLLLLVVSVMNYVLVVIGDVLHRSKEMAVRKCYGAFGRDIFRLLGVETAVDMLLALGLSLLLIFAFRGAIVSLLGVSLEELFSAESALVIGLILLVAFAVSALLPGQIFARIPISSAFRGYREARRKWKLTLLGGEIFVNVVLASLLVVVSLQYHYSLGADLGYNPQRLAYIRIQSLSGERMDQLCSEVSAMPQVEGAALTYTLPVESSSGNMIALPGSGKALFNVADQYGSSPEFFSLMGFRLIEGREPTGPKDVAVSRSFVEKMSEHVDWKDGAVGKGIEISEHTQGSSDVFTICGVYEDYIIGTPQDCDTRPSIRFCFDRKFEYTDFDWSRTMKTLVVRFRCLDAESMAAVNSLIKEFAPDTHDELLSYEEVLRERYEETLSLRRTYAVGSLFAILLALIGLVGYVRDESYRRSAEIAVRKVNGAQPWEIVSMMGASVLKISVVAILLGNLVAAVAANSWLSHFSMKATVGVWAFALTDVAVAALVLLVVVFCSHRIATANPVDSLRNE